MLTVTIITLNEAQNLRRMLPCLQTYKSRPQSLLKEILILDSGSSDETAQLAKTFGARFETRKFDGFGAQKRAATALASCDWILNLDADEIPDDAFWDGLEKFMRQQSQKIFAAKIVRDTVFLGKKLRFGGASGQRRVRVFHREHFDWNDVAVHEDVVAKNNETEIAEIDGRLLHYSWSSVSEAVTLLNGYSSRASQLRDGTSMFAVYFRFFGELFRSLVIRLGILDGTAGFCFCFLMAFSHQLKLMKSFENGLKTR